MASIKDANEKGAKEIIRTLWPTLTATAQSRCISAAGRSLIFTEVRNMVIDRGALNAGQLATLATLESMQAEVERLQAACKAFPRVQEGFKAPRIAVR